MDILLTDKEYQLERFSGKGGWTYVALPDVPKDKDAAFGIVKAKGTIDGYEFSGASLMPMKDNTLLLPVKAEIRKAIGKGEGDYVHVVLYRDDTVFQIPDDFKMRLEEENVLQAFKAYKVWEQRMCIKWIYSAKRPETVRERIVKTLFKLKRRERIV